MMTADKILLIAIVFIIQLFLILISFRQWPFRILYKNGSKHIAIFLMAQVVCGSLLFLGAYGEARWSLLTILHDLAHEKMSFSKRKFSSPETYELKGDPALVKWIQKQEPRLPRPDFTAPEAFRTWQASLRRILLEEVFRLPGTASPTDVRFHEISSATIETDIIRTFLVFESFDGTHIPAYLFVPSLPAPRPAILVLHGHVREEEEGITQTAGIVESYHHGVALELAKAGYVTLTFEFRGFGYLGAQIDMEHRFVAYNALLGGSFYKAIISKDVNYALDLLLSMEEVDPQNVGITGVSFGGEMAVTYAALDERIKAVVFQGFGGPVGPHQGVTGVRVSQQPHYCHIIPGQNTYMLQEDLFFLIAPRPLLGVRGSEEYHEGYVNHFMKTLNRAYDGLDSSSVLKFEVVSGGHEYFIRPAIRFFKQYLK